MCILNVHILDYKPWIITNFINLRDKFEYQIGSAKRTYSVQFWSGVLVKGAPLSKAGVPHLQLKKFSITTRCDQTF